MLSALVELPWAQLIVNGLALGSLYALAAFGIVLGLMTFVIPTFQGVLQEMVGGKLNPVTTTVLRISHLLFQPVQFRLFFQQELESSQAFLP